jgi:hypothetical protein
MLYDIQEDGKAQFAHVLVSASEQAAPPAPFSQSASFWDPNTSAQVLSVYRLAGSSEAWMQHKYLFTVEDLKDRPGWSGFLQVGH